MVLPDLDTSKASKRKRVATLSTSTSPEAKPNDSQFTAAGSTQNLDHSTASDTDLGEPRSIFDFLDDKNTTESDDDDNEDDDGQPEGDEDVKGRPGMSYR
jgi:hypothetical protein